MKRNERVVYFYDLKVKKHAAHAPVPSLRQMYDVWQARYDTGDCTLERERGTVTYRIGAIRLNEENQTLTLLVRKCDQNAPDAAYSKIDTGDFRTAPKEDDEGGDTAVHICVSMAEEIGSPGTHLCLIEGVNGISHRHIQPLLNRMVRDAGKDDTSLFQYADAAGARVRGGGPKMHNFVPVFELSGHASETFARDVAEGQVNGIELVKSRPQTQVGGSAYLTEKEYSLSIGVEKNIPRQNRLQSLITAMQTRSANFDDGKIRFKDPDGNSHTVSINLDTGQVEQQMYIKSYRILDIDPPMALSTETIVEHFVSQLLTRLVNDRNIEVQEGA